MAAGHDKGGEAPLRRATERIEQGREGIEAGIAGQLDNARITADVESALLALAPATGLRVDVDTDDGVVYLRGEVVSDWQRAEAERIAREACPRGARAVVNELRVNPGLPPLPKG